MLEDVPQKPYELRPDHGAPVQFDDLLDAMDAARALHQAAGIYRMEDGKLLATFRVLWSGPAKISWGLT